MKIASLFILFVMLTTMSFGQSELTPPSSPESQGLLRSLNIKVNKGTGTAGVSIPFVHDSCRRKCEYPDSVVIYLFRD